MGTYRMNRASSFLTGKVAAARRAAKAARTKSLVPKRLGVSAVDKGPIIDKAHRNRVNEHRCIICALPYPHAHHIRECFDRTMGKRIGDDMTVPLCVTHHAELHTLNNITFWQRYGIDPVAWAKAFYAETLRLREKPSAIKPGASRKAPGLSRCER